MTLFPLNTKEAGAAGNLNIPWFSWLDVNTIGGQCPLRSIDSTFLKKSRLSPEDDSTRTTQTRTFNYTNHSYLQPSIRIENIL